MIETIRKHSKWLLWIIAGATIVSMVFYMGTGSVRNGGGGEVNTNEVGGEIYGQKVTAEMYDKMRQDVDFDFLFNYGQWPEENPQVTKDILQQRIYVRMMQVEKAREMGVHVTDDQAEKAAVNFLHSPALERSFDMHDQSVPMNRLIPVLEQRGLSADDFENFVRNDLAIEQLQTLFGLGGQLITPQEATNEYVRENQEYSAQIVFFSASNYLGRVSVSSADVGRYYTNYMADYRLPDRVQVSYVLFSVSNYFGEAQQEMGTTNLDMQVTNLFQRYGMQATPDAKTTNEAMADIRNVLLRRQALQDASTQANNFAQSVFSIQATSPQNLATVARQKGLAIENPAPFSADFGPSEFTAPAAFTHTAFQLNPE
ncbi:MAG TPA: SurA N-terminal domain-containing protein, partial [Verrucomicrobiae bacterium]